MQLLTGKRPEVLHYLVSRPELNFTEIAELVGLSRERVRQIAKKHGYVSVTKPANPLYWKDRACRCPCGCQGYVETIAHARCRTCIDQGHSLTPVVHAHL